VGEYLTGTVPGTKPANLVESGFMGTVSMPLVHVNIGDDCQFPAYLAWEFACGECCSQVTAGGLVEECKLGFS
jgi:hypothetical protein